MTCKNIEEYRTSLFKLFTIHTNSVSGGFLDIFNTYPHLENDDYIKLAISKRYENDYKWYEKEFERLTTERKLKMQKMKMKIYDVNKIILGDTAESPYAHETGAMENKRTLYIYSAEGVIEIDLFADDADKLKAFSLYEDKSL